MANKKVLQDSCKKLRNQIEQLQQRLRSSSLSKVLESQKSHLQNSRLQLKTQQQIPTTDNAIRQRLKQEYERKLASVERDYHEKKQTLRREYDNQLAQLNRKQSVPNIPRPSCNKENVNVANLGRQKEEKVRLYESIKKGVREFSAKTPVGKSIISKPLLTSKLQYDSSDQQTYQPKPPNHRLRRVI